MKKNFQRGMAILLVIALMAALTACGGTGESTASEQSKDETASKASEVTTEATVTAEVTEAAEEAENTSTSAAQDEASAETEETENDVADVSSDESVFRIETADDLVEFRDRVNAGETELNAVLTADIDLSEVCGEGIGNWVSIDVYNGTFDGDGYTISGLYSVDTSANNTSGGLFRNLGENSVVCNLTMKDVVTEMTRGGCIAEDSDGLIENCHADGSITATIDGGGLVCYGTYLKDCTFSGTIIGTDQVGGLARRAKTVENCRNLGTVIAFQEKELTGYSEGEPDGIVNYAESVIGCVNEGTVIGSYAAGIVGGNGVEKSICVEDCSNTGTVIGMQWAAGIGYRFLDGSVVNRCVNSGNLYAGFQAAGIATSCNVEISNSCNKGSIEVGPVQVNEKLAEMGMEENTADVDSYTEIEAAGIVLDGRAVVNCYSQGSITAYAAKYDGMAYGIAGRLGDSNMRNCYSNASLTAAGMSLGFKELGEDGDFAESCYYSTQTAERATSDEDSEILPTDAVKFTDGTVTESLNAWVQAADGEYSGWVQGTDGPVFDWE